MAARGRVVYGRQGWIRGEHVTRVFQSIIDDYLCETKNHRMHLYCGNFNDFITMAKTTVVVRALYGGGA